MHTDGFGHLIRLVVANVNGLPITLRTFASISVFTWVVRIQEAKADRIQAALEEHQGSQQEEHPGSQEEARSLEE